MARINGTFLEALRHSDAGKLASVYHEDAKLLVADGDIVRGRSNIEAFYRDFLAGGFEDHIYERLELEQRGDLAFEIAHFTMIVRGEDGERRSRGKHLLILKFSAGRWTVYADIWNYSPG